MLTPHDPLYRSFYEKRLSLTCKLHVMKQKAAKVITTGFNDEEDNLKHIFVERIVH